MSITTRVAHGGKQIDIAVAGRFDFRMHDEFRKAYEVDVERGGSFVVDLGRTEYIDSSALGMLLMLHDRAKQSGANVSVRNCGESVRRVLEIARLDKVMEIR